MIFTQSYIIYATFLMNTGISTSSLAIIWDKIILLYYVRTLETQMQKVKYA